MTSISVQSVGMRYGTADQGVVALSKASFDVKTSEFVSILGSSGCGKSTLLMIIAGLVKPTEGSVSVQGVRVTRPMTDLGIVFQQDLLFDWRTVLGNVMLQADVRGLPNRPPGKRRNVFCAKSASSNSKTTGLGNYLAACGSALRFAARCFLAPQRSCLMSHLERSTH